MKTLLVVLAVALAGCTTLQATLTPNKVDPVVINSTNTAMALVAAQSGDCSVAITSPNVGKACANLPQTATDKEAQDAFNSCLSAALSMQAVNKAAALQAALCAKAGTVVVPAAPVNVVVPLVK